MGLPDGPEVSLSSTRRSDENPIRKIFGWHGQFCGSQPWEVIVATTTFLVCFVSIAEKRSVVDIKSPVIEETSILEIIFITTIRCLACLLCYYRFKKISLLGSTLLLKISVLYLAFNWSVFVLMITSLRSSEALLDSWFLFLLLVDIPKMTRMAQFALSSPHSHYIHKNLGHGMFVLAPSMTLDTLSKVLLFGLGSYTGVRRLELLSFISIVTIMINYLVYLTFYPAFLSLILDQNYSHDGRPGWNVAHILKTLSRDECNSVLHRFRVLSTAALVIVHMICRVYFLESGVSEVEGAEDPYSLTLLQNQGLFFLFALLSSLFYLFNQDLDESSELRKSYLEELSKKCEEDEEALDYILNKIEQISNSTDEGISSSSCSSGSGSGSEISKRPPTAIPALRVTRDDSSSEYAWSEVCQQEAQTTDLTSSDDEKDEKDTERETEHENEKGSENNGIGNEKSQMRSIEDCLKIFNGPSSCLENENKSALSDEEIISLVESKHIRSHALEVIVGNAFRGVELRRKYLSRVNTLFKKAFENLPYTYYDYERVLGACCESVVGYIPLPVGVVGPLKLDDKFFHVPMATTEGCLVASTNRGCSALSKCGVTSRITDDGMSRGPVIRFSNVDSATQAKAWMETPQHFALIKSYFDSTSRFARLTRLRIRIAGRMLYLRFVAKTGDAMGMNMLSKATEVALTKLSDVFLDMQIISISGNYCTDKKPAAVNWIEGRGKSVVCEAIVPASVLETTLKTTAAALIDLNSTKNQTGSAMAGSIGGFNAHAANIVTAIFIATGQDAAQNVASSNCITLMEPWGLGGKDLYITCTMPSIEVGTVGGGTILAPQASCLELMGIQGPHLSYPGSNACQLARIICGSVLAGELSLMSALATGHLVRSHLKHNRSDLASTLRFDN